MRTATIALMLVVGVHSGGVSAWAASRKEKCDDPKQNTKLWEQVYERCIGTPRADSDYCILTRPSYIVIAPHQWNKPYRLLFIPTSPVPGIEAAARLDPGVWESYLREAWNVRPRFLARAHVHQPLENVGLAINSALDRGTCHLHIHIDCVGTRTRSALKGQSVGSEWVRLTGLPAFSARLFGESQFDEIAREAIHVSEPLETLASLTVVLVPAPRHGVYVLRSHHGLGGSGAGEELLDAKCNALDAPP